MPLFVSIMRSIELYLKAASADDVSTALNEFAVSVPSDYRPMWYYPQVENSVLRIEVFNQFKDDEPEEYAGVVAHLGWEPSIILSAYVSGKHPGNEEMRSFALFILERFEGMVDDEYSTHLWTKKEIVTNYRHEDLPFFDTLGWYERNRQNDSGQ